MPASPGHGPQQRSASSPIASTSKHFEYPPTSISLPTSPPGPRSASAGRPPLKRAVRSSSAPSPLLSSTLHAHDFPLEEETTSKGYAFETTKHAGPASLKRIFIGPHTVGVGPDGPRKGPRRVGDHGSGSDEDSLGSDTSEEEDEGRRRRIRDKLAKRTRKRGDRFASGSTVATGTGGGGKKVSMQKWTGGSFEVGGDIRAAAKRRDDASKRRAQTIRDLASSMSPGATATATQPANSFVTAKTHLDPTKSARASTTSKNKLNGHYKPKLPPIKIENALPALTHDLLRKKSNLPLDTASVNLPPSTDVPEIIIDPVPPPNPKSILRTAPVSALGNGYPANRATYLNGNAIPSGAKSVQLPISRQNSSPWSSSKVETLSSMGDAPPVPAAEVLARPGDKAGVLDETGASSAFEEALKRRPGKNTVLKKDRMLVRVEWTQRDDLPDLFNEEAARKYPTRQEVWQEYAVVWRRHRLELWTEPTISLKSVVFGQKKLAHVIPLLPARTKLSLYSSPDVIFCLAHHPDSSSRGREEREKDRSKEPKAKTTHHFRRTGTNVYIMRPRSIRVAKEWMWDLYLELGGSIPSSLEISVPGLGARLHLPLPTDEEMPSTIRKVSRGGYLALSDGQSKFQRSYSPKDIVGICKQYLSDVTDWKELFAQAEEEGLELRLAWRRGNVLDWVGTEKDCKEWSVLGGIALCQPGIANTLELRPALHYPTTCRLPSTPTEPSKRLSEPPGIEGYLTRLRPNGKPERIYLSSHDGHLFLCRPSSAYPPDPPIPVREGLNNPAAIVLAPFLLGFASLGKPKETERDHLWERISGIQSRKASKRNDDIIGNLDSAEEVQSPLEAFEIEERKRIYQQIMAARGYLDLVSVESVKMGEENPSLLEVDDAGGEEGLAATKDKEVLKRHRSFVVRTKSGVDVRFECYSISVAKEWVGRLNALVTYWRRRERIDAIEQMELHPSLRSVSAQSTDPQNDLDELDTPTPLLSKIYNHCVMDGCRTILRQGRFYVRKGPRGLFQERLVFLLPGTMIEYQSKNRNLHGEATSTVYHQRKSSFSLRGVYVYSGSLAANVLGPVGGQGWDPADDKPRFPRIYTARDGLRTTDSEEDCTLVLFKRTNESKGLGKKGKITVFRARSKVERDEWLFALNAAIERLHRSEKEREERLKEFPWLEHTT